MARGYAKTQWERITVVVKYVGDWKGNQLCDTNIKRTWKWECGVYDEAQNDCSYVILAGCEIVINIKTIVEYSSLEEKKDIRYLMMHLYSDTR